ncbi:MAG: glycosyltransferase [Candidatus Riflebacteria bacterium]|nr:glycosyltransferase [Candidatus Riflebacteria bacterium]
MNPENVFIIMRSHNDMPLVAETLRMVAKQEHPFTLIGFDNASNDRTREEVHKFAAAVYKVPKGEYVPGRVLNNGMKSSSGEFVVFLNSDCTPVNNKWLTNLLAGFTDNSVAAVFSRQMPRPNCAPLFARETEEAYGDGHRQKFWKHCFSMASSAIRRSVWQKMSFDENLQYSEDIDWTWRVRQKGFNIQYVPDSAVFHSHNYSLKQYYKRHYGEGKAEARIFHWTDWEKFWLRYSLMPFVRQILTDWKFCLKSLDSKSFALSPALRLTQMLARREGFLIGLLEKRLRK